jgi:hypothetical protein
MAVWKSELMGIAVEALLAVENVCLEAALLKAEK